MVILLIILGLMAIFCLRVIHVVDCHIKALDNIALDDPEFYEKLDLIRNANENIQALQLTKWTTKQFFPELYND